MQDDIHIRWTEPHEYSEFAYSHSIVEAVLTCPVWGIIRYVKGLYYPTQHRQMALEAGSAMHEIFAAVRVWQLLRLQQLPGHFAHHGKRLFGDDRFNSAFREIDNPRDELINFCFNILNSSEFIDDPDDPMRTLANMEVTIIRYVDDMMPKMERNPIWVKDVADPTSPVGIEIVFDVILTYRGRSLRYIGTIDGIVVPPAFDGEGMIDENKTASRLDETWRKSYMVKSQPTGYIAVAQMITGLVVSRVRMIGCKVKQTRSAEDILSFIEEREPWQMQKWAQSLQHADDMVQKFKDEPLEAPQYTQSCSRYFRPCSFIDLCAAEPSEQAAIFDTMVPAGLTPSQQAVKDMENQV